MFITKILGIEVFSNDGPLLPKMITAADRLVSEGIIQEVVVLYRKEYNEDRIIYRVSIGGRGVIREKADDADLMLDQCAALGAQ